MEQDKEQTIGERITILRREQGLTQVQLAGQLGVSPQAVSKWESGQSCPDIMMLVPLSKIFGVSTDQLLGEEELSIPVFEELVPELEISASDAVGEASAGMETNDNRSLEIDDAIGNETNGMRVETGCDADQQVLCPMGEIHSLKISLGASATEIHEGDTFKMVLRGYDQGQCQSVVKNGVWEIKEQSGYLGIVIGFQRLFSRRKVIITVPAGFRFREVLLSIGAGTMLAEGIETDKCVLNVGAGQLTLRHWGSGATEIKCGMGEVKLQGELDGKCKISCGMGNVEMKLDQLQFYGYRLNCGMGEVKVGENHFGGIGGHQCMNKDARNFFEINCGMGNVAVQFV